MNKRRIFAAVAAVILAATVYSFCISAYGLTVSRYTLSSDKLTAPIRIVHLSDLHNSVFGENNKRLTDRVAAQEPGLIMITGDLLDRNEERTDIAAGLISALTDVAPVYVSLGNHEAEYTARYGTDLERLYTDAGAVVLNGRQTDVTVNGQVITVGGIYDYCLPKRAYWTEFTVSAEYSFLKDLEESEHYTVLLCHMPVSWVRYGSLEEWDVDCVLTGHAHGGQIRFPLIGGLWAPDEGWFPGRICGAYHSEDGSRTAILSRGLGNTDWVPRFNNVPEIVVVDLAPGEGG